jgi:hypothetical protein
MIRGLADLKPSARFDLWGTRLPVNGAIAPAFPLIGQLWRFRLTAADEGKENQMSGFLSDEEFTSAGTGAFWFG